MDSFLRGENKHGGHASTPPNEMAASPFAQGGELLIGGSRHPYPKIRNHLGGEGKKGISRSLFTSAVSVNANHHALLIKNSATRQRARGSRGVAKMAFKVRKWVL
jgi:hypothetical protein